MLKRRYEEAHSRCAETKNLHQRKLMKGLHILKI